MSNVAIIQPAVLRRLFGLDTFVETGCYQGDSMAQAYAAGFPKVFTCDISPESVAHCRQRFPKAAVLQAESTAMLGPIFPHLQPFIGRTLFWLDAHYPGYFGLDETPATRFPLSEELRLIRENKPDYAQDVIACDDLRVIRDPKNPRYRPKELTGADRYLYMDITLEELTVPFAATHTVSYVASQEGVLVLTPKKAPALAAA